MLHNQIFPDIDGDARHWGVGINGYGDVLVQISDEWANQVRIALGRDGARVLSEVLTMSSGTAPTTIFAGQGARNPAEHWSVSLEEPGTVQLTLTSSEYGIASVSMPNDVAMQMGSELAARLIDVTKRRPIDPT